ncbi:hypothetical protein [Clostridium sp. 1001271B_151109_B4]|uniref:hypothetical protein n=1 Tax=Clostridium sp. 1001271B_151109_B4 TaxID=2787148 RepID=UPI0018AADC0B|nr:hypothetical protein [Clostridium sp. 1001271B_151109_B4]
MSQDNFNVVQSDTLYDECLISKKIYGRCKQQDCLKPICGPMMPPSMPCSIDCSESSDSPGPVMPDACQIIPIPSSMLHATSLSSPNGSPIIGTITNGNTIIFDDTVKSLHLSNFATSITAKVNPQGQFNIPGFYDVVITYTFTYNLQLLDHSGSVLPVTVVGGAPGLPDNTIPAYTTYTKKISLEGGCVDDNTTVITFDSMNGEHSQSNAHNLPEVYVQAIANSLSTTICRYPVATDHAPMVCGRADIIIGLFTIIELYRITNMTVVTSDTGEIPKCQPSIVNDPCATFNQLSFPYDDFNPPYRNC